LISFDFFFLLGFHHLLIDLGLAHLSATAILGGVNILFILLAFELQDIGTLELGFLLLFLATLLITILKWLLNNKKKQQYNA